MFIRYRSQAASKFRENRRGREVKYLFGILDYREVASDATVLTVTVDCCIRNKQFLTIIKLIDSHYM